MRNEPEVPQAENPWDKIQVADRLKRLPPYLFATINKVKYEMRVEGIDVIDLGMGNPTDAPHPLITEKLKEAVNEPKNHRYSVANGIGNLRREVTRRYEKLYGVKLDKDKEVIACLGSKEGFSHMCLALMGPGDTALIPSPTFPIHAYSVMLAGGNVLAFDVTNPDQFLKNVSYTCQHLYPKPKLVIVNFPHNPSGTTIEQGFFDDLVKLAKQHNFMVISDFAYADICFDGYKAPSFLATAGAKDVGVELTTMSKGFSMAGWRIGYCSGNAEMVRALATIKGYYDYGIFQASQIAAIVAMQSCEDAVTAIAKEYEGRRNVLVEGLNRIGWDVKLPKAGMFVWAKIPEPWAQLGSIPFSLRLLREGAVAVSPGKGFGNEGEGYLRLAIVENEDRLRQGVRQIKQWMNGKGNMNPPSEETLAGAKLS